MGDKWPTEEDRVNCPFYYKIGACRNGDRCNRNHVRPESAQTIILPHVYPNLPESMAIANDDDWDDDTYAKSQEHVETFYEEVFLELANYGEIEDIVVLDNVSDHMLGNVYIKFYHEDSAKKAVDGLTNRFYGSRLIQAEYTPVTDFREARCRAFHETRCARGGLCNFMHIKHIPKAVKRRLVREMYEEHPEFAGARFGGGVTDRERSRSRARKKEEKDKKKRQNSEERRAMIAKWNKERAGELEALAAGVGFIPVAPPPPPPAA